MEQYDRKDPELKGVGSKCKIDFSKDGVTYTNTDTQKIALSYIFTYDEGNYNFTPVASSTIAIEVCTKSNGDGFKTGYWICNHR